MLITLSKKTICIISRACRRLRADTHHVLDSGQQLSKHQLALQVGEAPPSADVGEELPSAGVLHDQVQALVGLHHLVQTNDVWVGQLLHA